MTINIGAIKRSTLKILNSIHFNSCIVSRVVFMNRHYGPKQKRNYNTLQNRLKVCESESCFGHYRYLTKSSFRIRGHENLKAATNGYIRLYQTPLERVGAFN